MTAGTTLGQRTPAPPAGPTQASDAFGPLPRVLLAVAVALLVGAGLVVRLGLVGGEAIGAADNGDGNRLYCVAGLVPDATNRDATGHGVTVTEYRTGGPGCGTATPATSAGTVLEATVAVTTALDATPPAPDGSQRFSLEWLAGVYVALLALGAGAATVVATTGRAGRRALVAALAVVAPPLAPLLVVPWWSRFLVSTFSEPAGLVGTVWLAWGLLAVAVTRPADRAARLIALGLMAGGGLLAATAKPGFLPIGLLAVASCALVTVGRARWRRHAPGVAAAVLAVAVAASPVLANVRYQDEAYAVVNAHNLAFTAVLPESGPAATAALGLRPEAWQQSGQHFYLDGGRSVPGWAETVGARPAELRSAAQGWVVEHPLVLARMVHRGLVATLRPQIPYLASETGGARTVDGTVPRPAYPEGSQTMGAMFVYLDGLPGRWVPPAVLALALLAAALSLLAPRRLRVATPAVRGLARVAGALGVGALGVVGLAVLGDGYCELAKHVWLGSYALLVAGLVLVVGGVAGGLRLARARRAPHHGPGTNDLGGRTWSIGPFPNRRAG